MLGYTPYRYNDNAWTIKNATIKINVYENQIVIMSSCFNFDMKNHIQ